MVGFKPLLPSGIELEARAIATAELEPCFVPGQDCTGLIVHEIADAESELLVQAYAFTSAPIIVAIAQAKDRGVDVQVILDKSNQRDRYTGATYLVNHGIEPLIDDTVAIAHNKIIIVDEREVITGSFNFSRAAQHRNAENVLVVHDDPELAKAYADNWRKRAAVSHPYRDFRLTDSPGRNSPAASGSS